VEFQVLASDYDGTLAHDSYVDAQTMAAVDRLIDSERHFFK
jgi:hydroxymethylpyrimidine pyrophosphatase-like HAD family hydrolase